MNTKPLTDKQLTALRLLASGHSMKSVAREMGISEAATKDRMAVLRAKLQATTTAQALFLAQQRGIL